MKPSEVLVKQKDPKARLKFGCSETEELVKYILQWLSINGDTWDTKIDWDSINGFMVYQGSYHKLSRLLDHSHLLGGPDEEGCVTYHPCDFKAYYMKGDILHPVIVARLQGKNWEEIPESEDPEWDDRYKGWQKTSPTK